MCDSKPSSPKPAPILPPPAEPAEFLNEELQQDAASRKILGVRRLQAPMISAGGSVVPTGGSIGSLQALSKARAAGSPGRSEVRSVEGGLTLYETTTRTPASRTSVGRGSSNRLVTTPATSTTTISTRRPSVSLGRYRGRPNLSPQGSTTTRSFTGSRVVTRDGVTTYRASN